MKRLLKKLGLSKNKGKNIKISSKPKEKDANPGSEKLSGIDFNHKEKEVILKGSVFSKEEKRKK